MNPLEIPSSIPVKAVQETVVKPPHDPVNHPSHYITPQGVECLDVIEQLGFNFRIGNAFKYLWRYLTKGNAIENLRKAAFYINREIAALEAAVIPEKPITTEEFQVEKYRLEECSLCRGRNVITRRIGELSIDDKCLRCVDGKVKVYA